MGSLVPYAHMHIQTRIHRREMVKQYGLTCPNGIFKASYALSKISNIKCMCLDHTQTVSM